jgi:hypothetical protein
VLEVEEVVADMVLENVLLAWRIDELEYRRHHDSYCHTLSSYMCFPTRSIEMSNIHKGKIGR